MEKDPPTWKSVKDKWGGIVTGLIKFVIKSVVVNLDCYFCYLLSFSVFTCLLTGGYLHIILHCRLQSKKGTFSFFLFFG